MDVALQLKADMQWQLEGTLTRAPGQTQSTCHASSVRQLFSQPVAHLIQPSDQPFHRAQLSALVRQLPNDIDFKQLIRLHFTCKPIQDGHENSPGRGVRPA